MKRNFLAMTLALLLCVSLLSGCRRTDEPDPKPTPTAAPDTLPDTPDTIVNLPDPDTDPETEDFTLEIEGISEQVSMTLVSGSFRLMGGPDFSLYVDKTQYQVNDVDGFCYITNDIGNAYAEIGFRETATASALSGSLLREYGTMQNTEDLGEETLGGYTARLLLGTTMDSVFTAYLIDVDGGCVTLVTCVPFEDVEGHGTRLKASLETLELS